MANKTRPTTKELEALRLYRIEGKTQWQAYMAVHEGCAESTARSHASEYIMNAEAKLTLSDMLQLYDLGPGRVLREIAAHLKATNKLAFRGLLTGEEVADNTNRARANELLAKINGMADKPGRTEPETEGGDSLHIVIDNG